MLRCKSKVAMLAQNICETTTKSAESLPCRAIIFLPLTMNSVYAAMLCPYLGVIPAEYWKAYFLTNVHRFLRVNKLDR